MTEIKRELFDRKLDTKTYLCFSRAVHEIVGSQGDVTVMKMDERIHSITGGVTL